MATEILAQAEQTDVCDTGIDIICDWVLEATGNEQLARFVDWFMERPIKVAFVFLIAFVANRLVRRAIARSVDRMVADREAKREQREALEVEDGRFDDLQQKAMEKTRNILARAERSKQRAQTLGSVLASTASVAVYTLATLIALSEFEVNLGPLIAGAGIVGIALGFGSQTIVQDFLAGMFMIIEDQYGVGDVVNLGEATGVVEQISLRTTSIRDVEGSVWHFPNGEIKRVANKSQLYARSVLDIEVAYDTDIDLARRVIQEAAAEVWEEHHEHATILEEPEIWGIERFGESAIAIRLVVKTEPGEQWAASREIRERIKRAFDAEGIVIPFPQRVIWQHPAEPEPEPVG
ncbi:MAG TPA: mechanosensitive ion channel family protein [Acidimicrobiia bacterium]|jgi:small conductance mechanosensitive channel|nr:mechanosensitive ion channel family protein [Acidimicrobiia bacterium]